MSSREPELYKDKIEVSLEGRQIFYLFFGGAVLVGLVFVLGVVVGRRVEARGHLDRVAAPAATDPLAALDRLEGGGGLSFRGALSGGDAASEVDKTIADLERARHAAAQGAGHEPPSDHGAPVAADDVAAEPAADVAEPPAAAPSVAHAAAAEHGVEARVAEPSAKKKGKHDKKAKSEKSEKSDKSEKIEKADAEAPKADKADDKKGRFTLQLSSFQDKGEADAFLAEVHSSGYQAYVTTAEVDGKGTFYRVRLGTYKSYAAAVDAKGAFEKAAKKVAYVTKL
jgi:cell division septation protein DedD